MKRLVVFVAVLVASRLLGAAPVRVSFLDTDAAREDTLRILADTGCEPTNLDVLRKAIVHYYQTPLTIDTSAFPPATDGFHEFDAVGDFVSALGTNQLSYLDHPFELNCIDAALLLAAQGMSVTATLHAQEATYLAIQVYSNFNEWLVPVASLGDVYATAHPPEKVPFMTRAFGIDFPEKHKTLEAAFYQYQTLPLGTAPETIASATRNALQRHWKRCGVRFSNHVSLVMLHRARADYHLAVTDHFGVLMKRGNNYIYLEKAGGRGPFLRIDIQDPADVAAYLSTVTWPDYPFNYMSANDDLFLDVPLRPAAASSTSTPAASNP